MDDRGLRRHTSLTSVRHGERRGHEGGLVRSASGHSIVQNLHRPEYMPVARRGDPEGFYSNADNRHKSMPISPPRRPPPPSLRDRESPALHRGDERRKSTLKSIRRLIRKYFGISKKSSAEGAAQSRQVPGEPRRQTVTAYPSRPWMRDSLRVLPSSTGPSESHLRERDRALSASSAPSRASRTPMQRFPPHTPLDDDDSGVESPSTCERQSLSTSRNHEFFVPCITGIYNHGNSCYINAVMQCLAGADALAEYFISEKYAKDLQDRTRVQAAQAREFGTAGAVTRAVAGMMQALWTNACGENVSSAFKSLVGQFSPDYRSSNQQDAQEFLVWLLDKVHEDLNTATKRTYRQPSKAGSEEDLAGASLELHRRAHCSSITELFEGQSRSSIYCTACQYSKLNFEPYICASLPVPQDTKKPLFVTVCFVNRRPRLMRFGLNVECNARIGDVKQCIAAETAIPPNQLIVVLLCESGLRASLTERMDIASLQSNTIFAVELTAIAAPIDHYSSHDQLNVVFSLVVGNGYHAKRHGEPFSCLVSREWSYDELCRHMLETSRELRAIRSQGDTQLPPLSALRLRIVDDFAHGDYLDGSVTMPLFTEAVDRALSYDCKSLSTMPCLRLNMEWIASTAHRYLSEKIEPLVDHHSCLILHEQMRAPAATLLHCIQEYTRTETLSEWRCENCGERKLAEKCLKFRSLPQVLVFHLKRFRHLPDGEMIKLDREVQFPLDSLDMSPFVFHSGQTPTPMRKNSQSQQVQSVFVRGGSRGSSKRRSTNARQANNGSDTQLYVNTDCGEMYDLFAVVNHRGESINSGHYTAVVRNPVDGKWRLFDDTHVVEIDMAQVVTASAYLLFYERRARSAIPSVHSSSESGFGDHWFHRLPPHIPNRVVTPPTTNGHVAFRRADISRRAHSPTRRGTQPPTRPVLPHANQATTCSSIETDL